MAGCGRGTGLVDGVRLRSSLRDSAGVGRSRFPGFHPGLRSWRAYGTQSCWRVAARCGTGRHARRVTSARGGRRYGCGELVALACASGSDWETKAGRTTPQVGGSWHHSGAARPGSAWGARLPGTTSLATLVRPPGGNSSLSGGNVGRWEGGKVAVAGSGSEGRGSRCACERLLARSGAARPGSARTRANCSGLASVRGDTPRLGSDKGELHYGR